MKKKVIKKKSGKCKVYFKGCKSSGCGGVYGIGFIGAVIYYISIASGFWMGVLGVLKSLVWPAFLVYELFKFLAV